MAIGRRASSGGRLACPARVFFNTVRVLTSDVWRRPPPKVEKKMQETTFDGGSLGSRIDEERSQLR